MAKVVLNGEKPALADAIAVVTDGARVEFDAGFAEKIRLTAPAGSFAAATALEAPKDAGTSLDRATTRAATFGALLRIAHVQSGVRLEAVEWLAALLSNAAAPMWHAGASCEEQIAALARDGLGDSIPALAGPGFTDSEMAVLRLGGGCDAGRVLYAAWRAREMAMNSDAVAALTAEALRAGVVATTTDTEWSDVRRAHEGQKVAAERLRLLLAASTRLDGQASSVQPGPAKDEGKADLSSAAVAAPHEISGPVNVCLRSALSAARVEASAAPAIEGAGSMAPAAARAAAMGAASKEAEGKLRRKPCTALQVRPYHAAQLLLVATQATDATAALTDASRARTAAMRGGGQGHGGVGTSGDEAAADGDDGRSVGTSVGARILGGVSAAESLLQLRATTAVLERTVSECASALAAEVLASDRLLCAEEEAEAASQATKGAGKAGKIKAANEKLAAKIAEAEAALAAMEDGKDKKKQAKKLRKDKEALEKAEGKLAAMMGASGVDGVPVAPTIGLGRGCKAVREFIGENYRVPCTAEGEGASLVLRVPVLEAAAAAALVDSAVDRLRRSAGAATETAPSSGAGAGVGSAGATARQSLRSFCDELYVSLAGSGSKVKVARGARDFMPDQMAARELCFTIIRNVFKRHGAVEIDTPVFELRSTLTGKYGEEGGKLIYDLADQGGELLSLRYDLTVPFARFLALHGINRLKRFHIARVYRRDNPQILKGRYREFYQCDFDVAGEYPLMMPDADVLKVACEILGDLPIGGFQIKLNHRGLLDGILDIAGVPAAKFRTICSAIDKLDKEPWENVMEEMVTEKGLSEDVARRIEAIIMQGGKPRAGSPKVLLEELVKAGTFSPHAGASRALEELGVLFEYLEAMECLDRISFDLTLARGLDYYTGVIYEAVLTSPSAVGSIAAGGRYDNLVGMFQGSGSESKQVPCVGVSIGIERVFTIMEQKMAAAKAAASDVPEISVASMGNGMEAERFRVCAQLWKAGFRAETKFTTNLKFGKALEEALDQGRRYLVFFGDSELADGTVKIKDLLEEREASVTREELTGQLIAWGAQQQSRTPIARAEEISRLAEAAEANAEGADAGAGALAVPSAEGGGD